METEPTELEKRKNELKTFPKASYYASLFSFP